VPKQAGLLGFGISPICVFEAIMDTCIEQTEEEQFPVAELVRDAQAGDREAFGRLVAHFERTVYATVLRRLGNHAEAQELCQEVFMQALRKLDQLQEPACFVGWLRSIAVRMAINRGMRRSAVVTTESSVMEATCVDRQTPLSAVLAQERNVEVRRGLRRLKAADRATLVAFYFQGRSLVEMSDQFRSPVGTIKRRLHVARKRLAKELEALAPA
jgi:RNA polymerase sigma-70 factor (ECF subfamily)